MGTLLDITRCSVLPHYIAVLPIEEMISLTVLLFLVNIHNAALHPINGISDADCRVFDDCPEDTIECRLFGECDEAVTTTIQPPNIDCDLFGDCDDKTPTSTSTTTMPLMPGIDPNRIWG